MRLQRFTALALFALGLLPAAARAQTTDAGKADAPTPKAERLSADPSAGSDYWRLMGSPYTVHYHKDENNEHKPVYMIGLERQRSDGWVWGGVYFSNSFGQPSGYVYVGEKVPGFTPWEKLFFQWTAGVLYGYKYPYENKVPFNHNGWSPGATVSLGWQFTRDFSAQAIALGTAGMMFQVAIDLR